MKLIRRVRNTFFVLLMMNIILLNKLIIPMWMPFLGRVGIKLCTIIIIAVCFGIMEVLPCYERGQKVRIQVLAGGYELIVTTFWALLIEVLGYGLLFNRYGYWIAQKEMMTNLLFINAIIAYLILLLHYLNGFWRTAFCSSQLGVRLRFWMLLFWSIFPINIVLFVKWCAIVRRELIYERNQYLLDRARVESAVCRTKYPVVMVHGIFFRDWQFLNYWGRIPKELKRNGAIVYYGHQQSSLSVAESAGELKEEVLRILENTGASKVNIVAHSKGGLDARYAISKLGMEDYVASLTTINTPHRGCEFVDRILQKMPKCLINFVARRYNGIFKALGDKEPDFLAGVRDLTAASCKIFNETVPDSKKVYYQSIMSRMRNMRSAGFPLNFSYLLARMYDGQNDGLVGVDSAVWGNFMGVISAGYKGISHGDMIDLTHKNIKGFDVNEFYVQLFMGLAGKGF